MKLPKTVRVGNKEVRVIRHSMKPMKSELRVGNNRKFGHATLPDKPHEKPTITVNWGLDDDESLATMFHEIFHHCCPDLDEETIRRFESATMTAIVRLKQDRENWVWDATDSCWRKKRK